MHATQNFTMLLNILTDPRDRDALSLEKGIGNKILKPWALCIYIYIYTHIFQTIII